MSFVHFNVHSPNQLIGLSQLPLLFVLVEIFKADVSLKNRNGLTPLCLAAKQGEEKIAEVSCLNCCFISLTFGGIACGMMLGKSYRPYWN